MTTYIRVKKTHFENATLSNLPRLTKALRSFKNIDVSLIHANSDVCFVNYFWMILN